MKYERERIRDRKMRDKGIRSRSRSRKEVQGIVQEIRSRSKEEGVNAALKNEVREK